METLGLWSPALQDETEVMKALNDHCVIKS